MATIISIDKTEGVAGQVQYIVTADWQSARYTHSFVGTVYGDPGPVFLILENGAQVPVAQPERFGVRFNEQWVRQFYARYSE